jgi:phosphonate transport system substrate-binding protein
MRCVPRRSFLAASCAACLSGGARGNSGAPVLRFGLTPVFLDNQVAFLNQWREYLEARLKRPVQFVQRGSYRDVVALLVQGQIEAAWLCGYPYVRNSRQLKLVAVPLYRGEPLYRSYLIVPAADRTTRGLLDLRGKVFAYSDPDSNSGHLYTLYSLIKTREAPNSFFSRTFFTWGHRKVVDAVGVGFAQGGAVDGYVWDTLSRRHPELTSRTRVVERSPEFGFPPIVAQAAAPQAEFVALQAVLIQMRADPEGQQLLGRLNLDGFVPGRPELFDGVRDMSRLVDAG